MKRFHILVLCAAWLVCVLVGISILQAYASTPGQSLDAIPEWPLGTRLVRSGELPTLVMFVHPKCPCSRASLDELAILVARCQGRVKVQAVFYRPEGSAADWAHTDLELSAKNIPGVNTVDDEGGVEAARFGANTSGHVALFGVRGELLFSGGITAARGHAGDNVGRESIEKILFRESVENHQTPVFGCSLNSGCRP